MGKTERRCAHFFLSFAILLLGFGSLVLLYYAGQNTIELFWGGTSLYTDVMGRINRKVVTDDWYGLLALRGWAFGLLYVVPGLSGLVASMFYSRLTVIIHLAIAILALIPGSVLHSIGAVGLVMYRLLLVGGTSRYTPILGDCIYVRDDFIIPYTYEDTRCLIGRRAILLAIAAVSVLFLAWLFVLSHVLYCAFTFSTVTKHCVICRRQNSGDRQLLIPESRVEHSEENNGTEQAPRTNQSPGTPQTSTTRRHSKNRGKKVAPPVPPHATDGRCASAEPRPSTSSAIVTSRPLSASSGKNADYSRGVPIASMEEHRRVTSRTVAEVNAEVNTENKQDDGDGGSLDIARETHQSADIQVSSIEDVKLRAQDDDVCDFDKQPANTNTETSQTGESKTNTMSFLNVGYENEYIDNLV